MDKVSLLQTKLDAFTPSNENLDNKTEDLALIFNNASARAFNPKRQQFQKRPFDKPWFGPACKTARKNYHRARNIYIIKIKMFRLKIT